MGMDVYGKSGNYFRNNVWWWRPLADYIKEVAPEEITSNCQYWQSNDGDGLDAENSKKLADFLQAEIDSGRTKAYEAEYEKSQDALPDEKCDLCNGTGQRNDNIIQGTCNKCKGKGKVRPWPTYYPFSAENVQEFVNFLKESEGFEIC